MGGALGAVALYLIWLGWHAPYRQGRDSNVETGPYDAQQVAGLALSLLILAVLLAWRLAPRPAAFGVSGGLWIACSADAASRPSSDGLWPIGSFLVLCAGAGAALVVSEVALRLRRRQPAAR
ncbi:hypothetical protein [Nocardioides sambongensis]|uniref:hypothetical protein n=1 Tax=Nocardioides sambongensis TaxID=2589074 RepID=UPI00112D10D7|nr:hypothetical protein [Nocardioides sambongensis]